jgi:putative glutamine amidotransferase
MPHNCLNIELLMEERPKIGIPVRLEDEKNRFYVGRHYCEALEFFGAVPLMVPLIPKREYIRAVILNLDGILLPGSDSDVDPQRYGEDPHPNLKTVCPEKEDTDWLVIDEAEKLRLPILAICFGMQILNVYRKGTLYQDIAAQIPNSIKHEQGSPLGRNSHLISVIKEESLISGLIPTKERGKTKVNSHHHQAIKKIGKNLKATARASDGVIECLEDTRKDRFVIGVEWHPELSYETDVLSRGIFESFVKYCTGKKQQEENGFK